eukprot:CAMPEP_0176028374 /NCGR_PEP_ID=MMETSP0120_2-20121206/13925_1 /TAXON_ID=160619 /ORGANISM="Kryptoperidinium foliaceum, Strain CCMP 1326" /LENGTH=179 /DNA_ID=CAMNT_0017361583 /DNA_START=341 /DNA_END=880 /DNA_ORIENTATION=-
MDIYEEGSEPMAIFTGFVSVTRYFIEGLTVQEQRCLPEQSGFTVQDTSANFPLDRVGSFTLAGLAQNDLSVVQKSCTGWYWAVGPALMVGIFLRVLAGGVLHVSGRSRQNKTSLLKQFQKDTKLWIKVVAYMLCLIALFFFAAWLIVRVRGETGILPEEEAAAEVNPTDFFEEFVSELP